MELIQWRTISRNPRYVSYLARTLQAEQFIGTNDLDFNEIVQVPIVHLARMGGFSVKLQGINSSGWESNLWRPGRLDPRRDVSICNTDAGALLRHRLRVPLSLRQRYSRTPRRLCTDWPAGTPAPIPQTPRRYPQLHDD